MRAELLQPATCEPPAAGIPGPFPKRQRVRLVLPGCLWTARWVGAALVGQHVDCGPDLHHIGPAVHILALPLSFGAILVVDRLGFL